MYLKMVISGGQTGADEAGLEAAFQAGIETGGIAPKTYRTVDGSNYDLRDKYGLLEDSSYNYPPRTQKNVKLADATVRLAHNFNSRGEKLTYKYIKQEDQPHFDVDLNYLPPPIDFAEWLHKNKIEVLNVAGNRDTEDGWVYETATNWLRQAFLLLKEM